MEFLFAPMSDFKIIILVDFFCTACLYDINLGGTEVLFVFFNKKIILLFVATFGTVPHCHYVNR